MKKLVNLEGVRYMGLEKYFEAEESSVIDWKDIWKKANKGDYNSIAYIRVHKNSLSNKNCATKAGG